LHATRNAGILTRSRGPGADEPSRGGHFLGWEAWFSVAVVLGVLALLIATRIAPDLLLLAALGLLMATGILRPADALSGFSNEGVMTVAVLFIVAAALRETGGMALVVNRLLGLPKTVLAAQVRMMLPIATMSAFMNNTPLVAMMLPVIDDWTKKGRLAASKLMIPLSYAAVLGGTCSLIGTSTNLVVDGLLRSSGRPGMGMFEVAWVGLPSAAIGLVYILVFGRWLLPDRKPAISTLDDPREYTVEMMVPEGSALVGKSIEEAGLRNLPHTFLIEIERDGRIFPAVAPHERLLADDRLVFAGVVEAVVDLQKIRGLAPATNQVFKLDAPRARRTLIEAVVSPSCPMIGKTIRDGQFRSVYDAVVIAVARHGERLRKKIGDIVLQSGDTLLLEALPAFVKHQRNSRDFFLVSRVEGSTPPRHEKAWLAITLLVGMVVLNTLEVLPILVAASIAAGLMVASRCISWTSARRAVDIPVVLVIAAAFGVGKSLEVTGAAEVIAKSLIALGGSDPWVVLFVVYGVTMLFTEMITNNAAAALVFPIALEAAEQLGVDFRPFALAITMAASASFSTPIGYQTNLMVMGPGGYRFTDYIRIGLPLNLLMWLVASSIIPWVWSF